MRETSVQLVYYHFSKKKINISKALKPKIFTVYTRV